jgi:F-type H+-transporting ATPase subunit delta
MSARTAAARYARALFDVGVGEGASLDRLEADLSGFAALLRSNGALAGVLGNPAIPAARKRGVVEQLLARHPLSPIVSRLLLLLADHDRIGLVPDIAEAFRTRLMDHARIVRAEVTTAMPLPPDRLEALQQGLARATGRQVQIAPRVDPRIIGGAIARIGSTVYDGSVKTQLQKLRQQLTEAGT